jgi:hypothetical protein
LSAISSTACRAVGSEGAAGYRTLAKLGFAVSAALCAGVVLVLAWYAQPIQDDFCFASRWVDSPTPQQLGIGQYIGWYYLNWNGRWAMLSIDLLLFSAMASPAGYPVLVLLLIAAECVLIYLAVRRFVIDPRLAWFLTVLAALVYWATMPSPQQVIFWVSGAVPYGFPLSLTLLLLGLVVARRQPPSRLETVAPPVLAFVIPGFHELAGEILVFILSAGVLAAIFSKSAARGIWLMTWAASVLGFLVVYIAPGNAHRMAVAPSRGDIVTITGGLLDLLHYQLLPWCLDLHWLLALVIWLDPGIGAARARLAAISSPRGVIALGFVWVASLIIAAATMFWVSGNDRFPPRTLDFIYGVFLIGWAALAFLIRPPEPRSAIHPAHRAIALSVALGLLSVLVATSQNTVAAVRDIASGRAAAWNAELNSRFAALRAAGPQAEMRLPSLAAQPKNLAWEDITEDPNHFANWCLARYFGVASVRVSRIN